MIRRRERFLGRLHVAKPASCEVLDQSCVILPVDFLPFDLYCDVLKNVHNRRVEPFPVSAVGLKVFVALRLGSAHICNCSV